MNSGGFMVWRTTTAACCRGAHRI